MHQRHPAGVRAKEGRMKPKLDCPLCNVFMVQKRISVNTPPFYQCPICGSTFFPGAAAVTERQQQAARDGVRVRTPKRQKPVPAWDHYGG